LSFKKYPESFSRSFSLFYNFLIPKIARRSKGILTISDTVKNEIVESFQISPSKIETVYCSVANSLIRSSYEQKPSTEEKYILAVASLDPRKNFKRLIEAFVGLNCPGIKLVVCGNKNKVFNHESLASVFNSNINISHRGYVSDEELAHLYSNALLFAYPSIYEGFGMPPLEAMANGCPVLTSSIPSIQEVCGKAAFYCNPFDCEDIKHKLRLLIEDVCLRNELKKKGFSRVKDFNWDDSAMKIYQYIKQFN
jgi:glycosyltransferase involved in cell wall biosynthesis